MNGILSFPTPTAPAAPAPIAEVQGTLALAITPRVAPPRPRMRGRAGAVVVPIAQGMQAEMQRWSGRFVQAAVEIVGGDRPAHQLVRWTSEDVYADLTRRAELVARAGGHAPGQARVQPVHPKVVSVRTSFVESGIVEAAAHVRYGARSRAVAARFERHEDERGHPRWICTALEFA
jgi:hypothetical protein